MTESSKLEFLEKVSADNFLLSDSEGNTVGHRRAREEGRRIYFSWKRKQFAESQR